MRGGGGPVAATASRQDGGELATLLLGSTPRRIHLIGVAGSGMSGIAALLLALGHRVSGSDKVDTQEVERLRRKGLVFASPQGAELVDDSELVIFSSAIRPGNLAQAMRVSGITPADVNIVAIHIAKLGLGR